MHERLLTGPCFLLQMVSSHTPALVLLLAVYIHRLFNIAYLIGFAFALLRISSLLINSFHLVVKKHMVWKLVSFCSILLLVFPVSEQ